MRCGHTHTQLECEPICLFFREHDIIILEVYLPCFINRIFFIGSIHSTNFHHNMNYLCEIRITITIIPAHIHPND